MNNTRSWIIGIATGLIIMMLLVFGRSTRDAYWYARGAVVRPVQTTQGAARIPAYVINPATGKLNPIVLYTLRR